MTKRLTVADWRFLLNERLQRAQRALQTGPAYDRRAADEQAQKALAALAMLQRRAA